MEIHPNLLAYDNVEQLENFTEETFNRYCTEKLKLTSKHVSFIQRNCINFSWHGKVCEIGSGNSKLLYSLENEKLLREGIGIEISKSRFEFAEKFKIYAKSQTVTNLNEDILKIVKSSFDNFDLIIGVDIVLQLISPITKTAEKDILSWVFNSLKPKGFLILELWDFEHILKQLDLIKDNLQMWEEFSQNDPFQFLLSQINLNEEKNIFKERFY